MESSLEARQKGNKLLQSATPDIGNSLVRSRLQDAAKWYSIALQQSRNANDSASASKNLGVAHFKITQTYLDEYLVPSIEPLCFHLKEALYNSLIASKSPLSPEWLAELKSSIQERVLKISLQSKVLEFSDRKRFLRQVCQATNEALKDAKTRQSTEVGWIYIELGEVIYHHCVKLSEQKATSTMIKPLLEECWEPLNRAIELSTDFKEKVQDLTESILFLKTSHESVVCRQLGDDLIKKVADDDDINLENFLLGIDMFREAMILAAGKDLENEAIATSRLAWVYSKAMADGKKKAFELYKHVITLGQSLQPKDVTKESWYLESALFIESYRLQRDVASGIDAEKAKVKIELELELKGIKEAADGSQTTFLQYIYEKHPPKGGEKLDHFMAIGKRILAAIKAYHPDKYMVDPLKTQVLMEEITKELGKFYDQTKQPTVSSYEDV